MAHVEGQAMTPDPDTVERMAEVYWNTLSAIRWCQVSEDAKDGCRKRMAAAIQAQRQHEEREAMR